MASVELPPNADFARDGADPARYARLSDDWALAVADIAGSTKLQPTGTFISSMGPVSASGARPKS